MKIDKVFEFYKESEKIFQCPICHGTLEIERPASMICQNRHCFNLAKDGYINFLPNQKQTKYQKELFESRRIVFENGYYEPLAMEICNLIGTYTSGKDTCRIMDMGCGEGYYEGVIKQQIKEAEVFAFDNVKEAIRMGARKYRGINWIVGNLAGLPVQEKVADIILEIFAPSNYTEFERILKEDGYLLKVIPGKGYLKELRSCIENQEQDSEKKYTSQSVETYFGEHMRLVERKTISYTKSVDKESKWHFVQMSPLMFGKSADHVNVDGMDMLTFEFVILLGTIADQNP